MPIDLCAQRERNELCTTNSATRLKRAAVGCVSVERSRALTILPALEGPSEQVHACFERIQEDARHHSCVVMLSEPVEERVFGRSDMARAAYDSLDLAQKKDFIHLRKLDPKMEEVSRREDADLLIRTFLSGFGSHFDSV